MNRLLHGLAIALTLAAAPALAARPGPTPAAPAPAAPAAEDLGLDDIVVTGRRGEQPAFESDRTIDRVSADDVRERQPRSIPELLNETPGAFVQETNRGAGAPFLRGLVGPQNLILVDGVRFNNSTYRTGPNQYLSMVDPSSIAGLEVMLGPGSVLYGSDAMGGVVNLQPFGWSPGLGFGGRAGARFRSADLSTGVWGDATWQGPTAQVLVGGAYRRFGTLRAGEGADQPLSEYQQGAWRARARWEPTEDVSIGLTYLATRIRDAGRADELYSGRFRFYDNDDDLLYLDASWSPGGALRDLRAAVSFHRTWEQVDRYRCDLRDDPQRGDMTPCLGLGVALHGAGRGGPIRDPLARQELYTDEVLTPGGLVTADLAFWDDRIRASVGADAYADFVSSRASQRRADADPAWEWTASDRGNFSDGSTYLTLGAFALIEGDLLPRSPHRLVAALGGRVAHFRAHAPDVPGLGDVDYDHTGFAGTASLRYLYERTFMTYATWAQGFRAPNLQETTVLGDTGTKFEVPNDDLGPERNDTFEGGVRLHVAGVRVRVSGFYTLLTDVIDEDPVDEATWRALGIDPVAVGDKLVARRVNRAEGWFAGVEGEVRAGPYHGIVPWARVAWIRGAVDQGDETVPARREPPLHGAVGLRYEGNQGRWFVELYSLWAARQDRLHPGDEADLRICENPATLGDTFADGGLACDGTPGWITLNVRAGLRVTDQLRLHLAATNLTDTRYRLHGSGFDAPGAGVALSAEGSF